MKNKLILSLLLLLATFVAASAQYRPQRIELHHGQFLDENGQVLSDRAVQALVGDEIFQETYVGAARQYRVGKNLLIGGASVFGGGLLLYLLSGITYETTDSESAESFAMAGLVTGACAMLAGGVLVDVGVPLMIVGTRRLAWIEDTCNEPKSWSLSLGPTRSGFGLALSF